MCQHQMSVSETLSPPPFSLWGVAGTFEKMVHCILQETMKAHQWNRSMAVLVPVPACSTSPGDELTCDLEASNIVRWSPSLVGHSGGGKAAFAYSAEEPGAGPECPIRAEMKLEKPRIHMMKGISYCGMFPGNSRFCCSGKCHLQGEDRSMCFC